MRYLLIFICFTHIISAQDLFYYAEKGDSAAVKKAIAFGAKVNDKGNGGNTALLFAASNGQTAVVRLLLDSKADINALNDLGATALIAAVEQGHLEIIKILLDKKANIHIKTKNGYNALMVSASHRNRDEIIKLLLERGAKVNETDEKGATALMMAAQDSNLSAVKLLLDKKADPNKQAKAGFTALGLASQKNSSDIIELLISRGAKANQEIQEGFAPIHSAVEYDNLKIVKLFVDKGADVNKVSKSGTTALLLASTKASEEMISYLIEKGANINAEHPFGYTALSLSAFKNKRQAVELLISKGAKITPKTASLTLIAAASGGFQELCLMALGAGADPEAYMEGETYLSVFAFPYKFDAYQLSKGNGQTVRFLQKSGNLDSSFFMVADKKLGVNAFRAAVMMGHEEIAVMMFDKLRDLKTPITQAAIYESVGNAMLDVVQAAYTKDIEVHYVPAPASKDEPAFKAAFYAAKKKKGLDVIKLMQQKGLNLNWLDEKGDTFLNDLCIYCDNTEMIRFLLEYKPDMEIGDAEGTTPLIQCAYAGCDENLKLLIESGANINAKETVTRGNSIKGRTALMTAASRGNLGAVYILLAQKNIDILAKDDTGKSALMYAVENKHTAIADLLKKAGAAE